LKPLSSFGVCRKTLGLAWILALVLSPAGASADSSGSSPQARLGMQLFRDVSLVNPGSKLQTSCATCHQMPTTTPLDRIYSDDIIRSVIPANQRDVALLTLRNTPSLLGVERDSHFFYDGRHTSLEALVADKLTGEMMGWTPNDRDRAIGQIQAVLINDAGGGGETPYRDQFRDAFKLDVESLSPDEALHATARAIAAFVSALDSSHTSPWDAFAAINRVPAGLSDEEPVERYAGRVIGRIENQTARRLLKRPEAFSQEALDGFKIFFKTEGEGPIGNCVTCHTPPSFSDGRFHNTGIARREYENVNGERTFGKINIPGAAEARRPSPSFLSIPTILDSQAVDLGHWNYVDLESSPQRNERKTDNDFLARMVGTFKTPRLRNVSLSAPYMHNGAYATLEDAVREIVKMSAKAQSGEYPGMAPEFQAMRLSDEHVAPLVAFLRALEDRGRDGFREMLINVAQPDFEELESF
jgi:cytochrome c peroxidase